MAVITQDGTRIYFEDWGSGQPVVFSHGWPLNGDAWENQMVFLAQNGYRTIAHDRRGHGRSSQPSGGNDLDTYAGWPLLQLTFAHLLLPSDALGRLDLSLDQCLGSSERPAASRGSL